MVSLLCRLLNIEGTMESGLKMVKLFLVFVVLICATTTATPTTARTTTTNANGSSFSAFLTSLNQALENLLAMAQHKVKMEFLDKADKDWITRINWKLFCLTKRYQKLNVRAKILEKKSQFWAIRNSFFFQFKKSDVKSVKLYSKTLSSQLKLNFRTKIGGLKQCEKAAQVLFLLSFFLIPCIVLLLGFFLITDGASFFTKVSRLHNYSFVFPLISKLTRRYCNTNSDFLAAK